MDRTIAIIGNKKYKAYVNRVGNKIIKIRLFSQKKDDGFSEIESAYDKYLYEKEVAEKDVIECYREYFMARYKGYDFFVITDNKISREIQILTANSNIGRECGLDWKDRDLFTKWLGEDDEYQLFYVKEYYFQDKTTRKEIILDDYFQIDSEEFR